MKVAIFGNKPSFLDSFLNANKTHNHELTFFEPQLNASTAVLGKGFPAVCVFVNDELDRQTLEILKDGGTKYIAVRATGYNNVDLQAAKEFGMTVVTVPAYSPHAVAEYAVGMLMSLNRKIVRGYIRAREGDFTLNGLMGYDVHSKTIGIVGTGRIGSIMARIMHGFGCRILAFDKYQNQDCLDLGVEYTDFETLCKESDIISLHCPLLQDTYHIINEKSISMMKDGVTIINTSRGALVDTNALVKGLKSKKVGAVALDVYEEEAGIFFEDLSNTIIEDDIFSRLLTFPNVLMTGHQAFFTKEAVANIASTTLANITDLETTGKCKNSIE